MDMPPPEPERIVVLPITARELAHETGYDVATICHWAKAGVIPVIRKLPGPRGAYLIDPRAVGLVQHKERKAPPPGVPTPPGGVLGQLALPDPDPGEERS